MSKGIANTNYIDELAKEIFWETNPDGSGFWFDDRLLYRAYALLLLAKGEAVSNEDVHNAWAVWAAEYDENHRSLIPFDKLEPHIQSLDEPYTLAIRKIAYKWRQRGLSLESL